MQRHRETVTERDRDRERHGERHRKKERDRDYPKDIETTHTNPSGKNRMLR